MPANLNDMELIAHLQRGEEDAFKMIYDREYLPIFRFAKKFIPDRQAAEDITTDTFLKCWEKRTNFEDIQKLQSFLFTATRNACLDFFRAEKRHQRSHQEIRYLADNTDPATDLEGINAEMLQHLYQEIETLPSQCKEVFKLYFFIGYSTQEVAHELNIATKTAAILPRTPFVHHFC